MTVCRSDVPGAAMAVGSAVSFGTLPILGKYAYAAGLTPAQLLSWRFLIATLGMVALSAAVGSSPLKMKPPRLAILVVLGIAGYGVQSFLFFTALIWLPAGFVELVFSAYPSIVVLMGWLLLGRRFERRFIIALACSFFGVALLIGGVESTLSFALALAIAVPVHYAAYLLIVEHAMRDQQALPASAAVMAGAAIFWLSIAAARSQLNLPSNSSAWLILAAFTIGPSMVAVPLLLAALKRIGSERVALLSTCEPVVTVLLAAALFGEQLGWAQALGAVLVISAMLTIYWPTAIAKTA